MPLPTDEKIIALANRILAQFDKLFGLHPTFRPAHAKGAMLTGTFTPTPAAATLSRAPHFLKPTPITARFSDSTGLPLIPDTDPNANPRGLALRFHLADRVHTDIVAHSADGFFGRTADDFLGFLQALGDTDPKKPSDPANPSPVEKFLATHPATLAFVQTPKPAPSSFARESYFGVNAFHFANADGQTQFGRYRITPAAGNDHLSPEATAAQGPNYLFEELTTRIAREPITFNFQIQLANPGDVVDDATIHWPADRPVLDAGTITLTKLIADGDAEAARIIFDPIPRVDGIDPSADPLLEVRAAIYLLSGRRRRAAAK